MKKLLSVVLVMMCIISLLPFSAHAQQDFPQWDYSTDTHVIPFSTGQQIIYEYTATKDEIIAFELDYGQAHIDLRDQSTEPVSAYPKVVRVMKNDKVIFALHFQAGHEYYISFLNFNDDRKDVEVKTYAWSESMYPTIQSGQTKSVTISKDKSVSFIATVTTSGLYTVSMGHKELHCNVSCYPDKSPNEYPSPVSLGYWQENEKYQYSYYLEAGIPYCVEIFYYGDADLTADFTLKQGDPSGDYAILKNGESMTLTIEPHDNDNMKFKTLVFQAERDGKYCLFSKTFSGDLRNSYGQPPEGGKNFEDADLNQGWVYELKKGEYYVITVHNYTETSKTDTISLTHYTDYNSGELKIIEYSDSSVKIGLYTDPACAALDGVEWSCSDPSLFDLEENASVPLLNVYPKKQGSAQITAKVGGLTKTITVSTSYTPPELQEGKTKYVAKASTSDPCAYFTPSVSGTYTLSFSPYYAGEVYRYSMVITDPTGGRIYNNYGFESWTDVEVELEAGVKYTVCADGSPSELRFDLKSAAATPTEPTQPEETQPSGNTGNNDSGNTGNTGNTGNNGNSGSNDTTQPTTPSTEPSGSTTEPTKPVEGTKPTDPATTPTQPSLPPVQGDKVEIQIENGGAVVTPDAVEDIIQNGASQTLVVDVSKEADVTFVSMDTQALKLATANNCSVTFVFSDDIRLELDAGCISNIAGKADEKGISLKVTPRKSSELNDMQKSTLQSMNVAAIVDIELHCAGDLVHELGSKAYITIPCPDAASGNWSVFYIDKDGKLEEMPVIEKQKDAIIVVTEHFSTFVLAENVPLADAAAQNGGSGWWIALVIIVVLAGGAVAAYFILKKKDMLPAFLKK